MMALVGAVGRRRGRRLTRAAIHVAAALCILLVATGCGGTDDSTAGRVDPRTAPRPGRTDGGVSQTAPPPSYPAPSSGYGGQYAPQGSGQTTQRGNTPESASFAAWVLSTDPQRKYIVDAFVRDNRTLGVIVSPTITRGQAQQAMGSLLNGMQRTFGNRPLEVIAYYTSGDELSRMQWDPRTGKTAQTWKG